jgi:hypothetical protein
MVMGVEHSGAAWGRHDSDQERICSNNSTRKFVASFLPPSHLHAYKLPRFEQIDAKSQTTDSPCIVLHKALSLA